MAVAQTIDILSELEKVSVLIPEVRSRYTRSSVDR